MALIQIMTRKNFQIEDFKNHFLIGMQKLATS